MTMNNEKAFRVYRSKEGEAEGEKKWRRMRRGLADLHRRGEVSQKVNERYLEGLASVDDSARLQEIPGPVEKRKQWKGRPIRALHPLAQKPFYACSVEIRRQEAPGRHSAMIAMTAEVPGDGRRSGTDRLVAENLPPTALTSENKYPACRAHPIPVAPPPPAEKTRRPSPAPRPPPRTAGPLRPGLPRCASRV